MRALQAAQLGFHLHRCHSVVQLLLPFADRERLPPTTASTASANVCPPKFPLRGMPLRAPLCVWSAQASGMVRRQSRSNSGVMQRGPQEGS
jgi:hypothetical protein